MSEPIENTVARLRQQLADAEAEQQRQLEAGAEARQQDAERRARLAEVGAELRALVAEYNATEEVQHLRRLVLFQRLAELEGGREVRFVNGGLWSNAWPMAHDHPYAHALEIRMRQHVAPMDQRITQINAGEALQWGG